MYNYINRVFIYGLVYLLISCADSVSLDESEYNGIGDISYEVNLGFSPNLEIKSNASTREVSVTHNYVYTGYDVTIVGKVVGGDLNLTDVDLRETISVEIFGDIIVSVNHPNFVVDAVVDMAYLDLQDYQFRYPSDGDGGPRAKPGGSGDPYDPVDDNYVLPLELVQGYVKIQAEGAILNFINKITIDGELSDVNTVYYTGKEDDNMITEVSFPFGIVLKGIYPNRIGNGVVYQVEFSDVIGQRKTNNNIQDEDIRMKILSSEF